MTGFGADLLGWTDGALAEIQQLRGWTEQAIERLALEWDDHDHRVEITVTDETFTPIGRLRYIPDPRHRINRRKMLADEGSERQLFPAPETISWNESGGKLLLTEGEPDTIAAWSYGYAAVAVPGTGGWQPEYASRFAGRRLEVYVVFDCDSAGRRSAHEVADSLAAAGVEVRIVDLDPSRDDKHDLTDYLLEHGAEELRSLLFQAQPWVTPAANGAVVVIETLREFLARELPPAESLAGVTRNGTNLLPRYGWMLPWGREGSGKTSVLVDLLFHLAAGLDWLHYPVHRPVRLVAIINEGVPGGLQDKLAQKLELWHGDHDLVQDNLAIYASPWGEFNFRNSALVEHARDYAHDFGADYVALDPLHTLGTIGAGSPQDTEAFKNELRGFGLWDNLGVITAHHSNKAGMISGDWARHADTVIHLEKDGKNPATKITLQKARPADPHELGVPAMLEWVVETMGYRRVELEPIKIVADEEILERIIARLSATESAVTMTDLQADVQGGKARISKVARDALGRGILANTATHAGRYAFRLSSSLSGTMGDDRREATKGEQTRMETGVQSPIDPIGDNG